VPLQRFEHLKDITLRSCFGSRRCARAGPRGNLLVNALSSAIRMRRWRHRAPVADATAGRNGWGKGAGMCSDENVRSVWCSDRALTGLLETGRPEMCRFFNHGCIGAVPRATVSISRS
jgi:hypothetical protein